MKKNKFFILLIVTVTLFGCTKTDNVPPAPATQSQWTVDGKTYFGDTTYYDSSSKSGQYFKSYDADSNIIYIYFSAIPTVNRNYTPISLIAGLNTTYCYFISSRYNNNSNVTYESLGTGGTVSATILNGKVYVSFSNVIMLNNLSGVITTISGELIQQ